MTVRTELVAARRRVTGSAWSIAQCGIAAGLAWALATGLLGHPRPFFACVAAVVCLGVRAAQRLRRVAELAVGVTVGVAVGDVLVGVLGTGAWQIGVVVGIALLLAVALDGGPLLVAQAGLQAVFVLALPRTPGGEFARWEDALLGGATALLVAALLPADPWRRARHDGEAVLLDLARVLSTSADAVRSGDPGLAADALDDARGTGVGLETWAEAVRTGHDISRLSPLRRDPGGRTHAAAHRLQSGVDRATRNLRVLVRRVEFALETDEPLPPMVPDLLDRLADVLVQLAERDDSADAALHLLARDLHPRAVKADSLSGQVVVGQLRSAVVDLLVAAGEDVERARAALPHL